MLVDSGPLYAYADADDRHHEACLRLLASHPGPLLVPVLVVTEAASLLGSRLGHHAEVRFLSDLAAGTFTVEQAAPPDWMRIAELIATYHDLPLGTVDASVVAAAERVKVVTIETLDRRDFGVVRPRHVSAFTLVP